MGMVTNFHTPENGMLYLNCLNHELVYTTAASFQLAAVQNVFRETQWKEQAKHLVLLRKMRPAVP